MFGLLDYLLFRFGNGNKDSVKSSELIAENFSNKGKTLVCFLPEIMLRKRLLGRRILNYDGNILAYKLTPGQIVQSNPSLTRSLLQETYEDAIHRILSREVNPEELVVLGVSLGNCPAYRFAAQTKAQRLISVVPGSRLAESIWGSNSVLEQVNEAKRKGFNLGDFQAQLHFFDPIEYVSKLSGIVEIYLGRFDRMIPYSLGKELALSLEEQSRIRNDLEVRTQTRVFGDHSSTAYSFARQFSKRRF